MKAIGSMIREIRKDMSVIATATPTKAIFKKVKHMEKEFIAGLMEKFMMENGVKELKMAMECGKVYLEIAIWANGLTQKLTDTGYTNGKMGIDLRVAGTNV